MKPKDKKEKTKLNRLYNLLSGVDSTYAYLPLSARLQIEKISQGLSEFGPRKLRRRGPGMEFFESRDFMPDVDDPRKINARMSARAGKPIVIEKEAEIRQHIYLWRDGTGSMDYCSDDTEYSKKTASEIMLLAFAKHLTKNEEMVGILDQKGMYRGGKAADALMHKLMNVNIVTGDMPKLGKRLPKNSTAILFSDFMTGSEELIKGLSQVQGQGLEGYVVMVLDPQEVEFDFKGHTEFNGMEDEGSKTFKKAESMRAAYQEAIRNHINQVEKICKAKGFKFILQRTDEPLHNALLQIYGLSSGKNNKPSGPKP